MTVLYFDCFSGAAGDMILGALIDAGVPLAAVRQALGGLAIDPETVWTERVVRAGVTATKLRVRGEDGGPAHIGSSAGATAHGDDSHSHGSHSHRPHGHAHGDERRHAHTVLAEAPAPPAATHHPAHRTLREIAQLIDGSGLSRPGKARAKALFERLGEAEAAIHGTPIDRVHLHEVGALDSIIDVVGTVFAFESLGIDRVVSSPLNVGSGTIESAHGRYPVPAPATMKLLLDVPVYAGDVRAELVTPTGALLVAGYAESFGPVPAMRVQRIGYGAGARDFPQTPNVLRVLIGEAEARAERQQVSVIEAEIDDMNPQLFGVVMDRLLAAGALDVFYTAIQMKKNRPGTLMTVMAPVADRERLSDIIFRETTTIGLRYIAMERDVLERELRTVTTAYGPVRIKIALRGGQLLNAAPEFDDCVRVAGTSGRPVKDIQAAAMKAFLDGDLPAD